MTRLGETYKSKLVNVGPRDTFGQRPHTHHTEPFFEIGKINDLLTKIFKWANPENFDIWASTYRVEVLTGSFPVLIVNGGRNWQQKPVLSKKMRR